MNISKIKIYFFAFIVSVVFLNSVTDIFSPRESINTTIKGEQSFGCYKTKFDYNRVASGFYNATSTVQAGVYKPADYTFNQNGWIDEFDIGGSGTANHVFMENVRVDGQYINGTKTIKYMYVENERQDLLDIGGSKTVKHIYMVNGWVDMGGSESVNYVYHKCWYNNDGSKTAEFKNELREKIKSLSNTQIKLYGL